MDARRWHGIAFLAVAVSSGACSGRSLASGTVLPGGGAGAAGGVGGTTAREIAAGGAIGTGAGGVAGGGADGTMSAAGGAAGGNGGRGGAGTPGPNGGPCATSADCVLPTGPCTSQDDCGGAAYANVVNCLPTSCDGPSFCTPLPFAQSEAPLELIGCSAVYLPVCGCDGATYPSDCYAQSAGVAVAYKGPCRTGAAASCDDTIPCPTGSACTDDPRDTCTGPGCPGICVTSQGGCGPTTSSAGNGVSSCAEGMCAAGATSCGGANLTCGVCAYAHGTTCDADHPCASPEICFPLLTCEGGQPCPSMCARP